MPLNPDRMNAKATRAAKLRGVHLAIVVVNREGDGNPGYRVKVQLPWLSTDNTHWARIAVPMAGVGRGSYCLPEPGDQVLVVFEHGEISRPIVIGSLSRVNFNSWSCGKSSAKREVATAWYVTVTWRVWPILCTGAAAGSN